MKKGYLSQYFDGVAVKQLSAVEVNVLSSNQHEFNGVEGLRKILGEPDGRVRYLAKFIYLSDEENEPIIEEGFLTWYDARQKARIERGVMRYEYRLYFPTNQVSQKANAGDMLIIAKLTNGTLLALVAESETTIAMQLMWLFGFSDLPNSGFSVRDELGTEQDRVAYTSRVILESIGVTVQALGEAWLDEILTKFDGRFPKTRDFSAFARSTLPEVNVQDGADVVLMAWMEREEILFRTLEKHLISERLSHGFDGDVDGFISFSLSVQNRRKSRAGLALENHLEILFLESGIQFTRAAITENKSKPDFIFPGIEAYKNLDFDPLNLIMLGVKSTCKDRWRQVLAEAKRIEYKHLLTLEPAISGNQTQEMQLNNVQLVLPEELHDTYSDSQKSWLMNVAQFIELVSERQQSCE